MKKFVGSVLLIFIVFNVVLCFCVLFIFVLCLVCPVLPVSLDCSFFVASSLFSNVYIEEMLVSRDEIQKKTYKQEYNDSIGGLHNSMISFSLVFVQSMMIPINYLAQVSWVMFSFSWGGCFTIFFISF